jgi:hypothetical protein
VHDFDATSSGGLKISMQVIVGLIMLVMEWTEYSLYSANHHFFATAAENFWRRIRAWNQDFSHETDEKNVIAVENLIPT